MPTLSAFCVLRENSMERWPSHGVTVGKRFALQFHVCASKCCYSFLFVSRFVDHVFFRQTWYLAAKPFYKRKYKLFNRNKLFDLFFPPLTQSESSNALKYLAVNTKHDTKLSEWVLKGRGDKRRLNFIYIEPKRIFFLWTLSLLNVNISVSLQYKRPLGFHPPSTTKCIWKKNWWTFKGYFAATKLYTFEFSHNTQSWQCWQLCTTSNANKLETA